MTSPHETLPTAMDLGNPWRQAVGDAASLSRDTGWNAEYPIIGDNPWNLTGGFIVP